MKKTALLLGSLIAFLTLLHAAEDRDFFRLDRAVELREAGIRIRPFKGTKPLPQPAPPAYIGRNGTHTIRAFQTRELWLHAQCAGYFAGGKVSLQAVRPSLPVPPEMRFMTEEQFAAWRSRAAAPDFSQSASRAEWLKYLTGKNMPERREWQPLPGGGDAYIAMIPPGKNTPWAVLICRAPAGAGGKKAMAKMNRCPLTVQTFPAAAKTPAAAVPARSAAYEASRRAVIASIQTLPEWWYRDTGHFLFVANIKRKKDIRIVSEDAEAVRTLYEQIMPPCRPIEAVSVIRVFDDPKEYHGYLGGGLDWSSGVWMAGRRELAFYIAPDAAKRDRQMLMRRVLRHELLHQYLFYACGEVHVPPWFNEGLAQCMEYVTFRAKGTADFRADRSVEQRVRTAYGSLYWSVPKILAMNNAEFQANHQVTYGAVLGLMYYLVKAAPLLRGQELYAQIPARYFAELSRTRSLAGAHAAAWKDVDVTALDRDFQAFWKSREITRVLKNERLPVLSLTGTQKMEETEK